VSLRRRLERLEGSSERYPECAGPWQPGDPVEYVVPWLIDEASFAAPPLREAGPCPTCGAPLAIEINITSWPDLPEAKLAGRRGGLLT
jgi:hypothetical protein